jgi:16S rRNA (adenine1518-N6/adenine1519-N6)-dimethyltransferase
LPKKSLGQNFLIDKNIIKKIINLSNIQNRHVIEIGPGNGELTDEIIKNKPKSITLIEKDFDLTKRLKKKYSENQNLIIFNDDILKFNLEKIIKKESMIIGNLPYNISSQILVKIIKFKKWPPNFFDLIFMFQKELGEKIIGLYQTPDYSRISILANSRLKVIKKFFVSPNCFRPIPKITSMVIHFKPKLTLLSTKNILKLEEITKIFFSNKRKMINKNIKKLLTQKQIKSLNQLNLKSRPSELKPEMYYKIAKLYEKIK